MKRHREREGDFETSKFKLMNEISNLKQNNDLSSSHKNDIENLKSKLEQKTEHLTKINNVLKEENEEMKNIVSSFYFPQNTKKKHFVFTSLTKHAPPPTHNIFNVRKMYFPHLKIVGEGVFFLQ